MSDVFSKENITNNSQLLDTWLFWCNHIACSMDEDIYDNEEEKNAAYMELLRSMSLLISIAREMPEEVFGAKTPESCKN